MGQRRARLAHLADPRPPRVQRPHTRLRPRDFGRRPSRGGRSGIDSAIEDAAVSASGAAAANGGAPSGEGVASMFEAMGDLGLILVDDAASGSAAADDDAASSVGDSGGPRRKKRSNIAAGACHCDRSGCIKRCAIRAQSAAQF